MTFKFSDRKTGWKQVTPFKARRRCFYNAFDMCPHAGIISLESTLGFIRNNCLVHICDGQLDPFLIISIFKGTVIVYLKKNDPGVSCRASVNRKARVDRMSTENKLLDA